MLLPSCVLLLCGVVSAWRQSCFGLAYPERDPETEANKGLGWPRTLSVQGRGPDLVEKTGSSCRISFFSFQVAAVWATLGRGHLLRLLEVIEWTHSTDWCVFVVDTACPGTPGSVSIHVSVTRPSETGRWLKRCRLDSGSQA